MYRGRVQKGMWRNMAGKGVRVYLLMWCFKNNKDCPGAQGILCDRLKSPKSSSVVVSQKTQMVIMDQDNSSEFRLL